MYSRILLKLSGEALADKTDNSVFDTACVKKMADTIKTLTDNNVKVGVVIGAGNIWRGKLAETIGLERVPADFMGMMGTVINAMALAGALNKIGVKTKVFSAINEIDNIVERYDIKKAKQSLDEGYVTFFAGGTGKPFFTTDTAATLRALEVECDAILMAKYGVDGVYDKDPLKHEDAKFFKSITYQEVLDLKLAVMDLSAVELVKDSNLQLRVFSMENPSNIIKVVNGSDIGTTVKRGK